jgi:hypothetical protein
MVRVMCIGLHQCIWWWQRERERAYPHGLCDRALGCNAILNVLLHKSQVYVHIHLTKDKNFTINTNLPVDSSGGGFIRAHAVENDHTALVCVVGR